MTGDVPDGGGGPCTNGTTRCNGNDVQVCSSGVFVQQEACPSVCSDGLGCTFCRPGEGLCNGETSRVCLPDGSGFDDFFCDPVQGQACDVDSGLCTGACAAQNLGTSYIGCEYFPTVTGNMVSAAYSFAVVVANSTSVNADVTIEGGGLMVTETFSVPANGVVVHKLPWEESLKLCVGASWSNCSSTHPDSVLAIGGSYRLRSTSPVTVYQFNPLDYFFSGAPENSFTNDASLLLPINVWRSDYYVATWQQTGGASPSLLAVTARFDGTAVTIDSRATTLAEGGAPAFAIGVPQTVVLNAGDVLQLGTVTGDLTGSHVTSDKPIQVIGGHYCANVPDGFGFCDHMEESMFSVDALSTKYIINAPAVTTIPNGKEQMVRIVATLPNTTLSYDPPQAGAPTSIANAGDFVEIARQAASYMITADHKVLVAQLMEGSTVAGGTGDPAMALAVPVDQFRRDYIVHAPTNYPTNYLDITAPTGSTVMLDGLAVTGFVAIGATGYSLARITPLGPGPQSDGNHVLSSPDPFGITVYGYGDDTSYWYPGGLDLTDIPVE